MFKPVISLIICLCLISNVLKSQHPAYQQFSIDNGLAGSTVYHAFQDSKGFIWFSTETGVSKYDGYHFKNFTIENGLPDNEIFETFEDSYERIWFLSFNGKISYYKNDKIHDSTTDSFLKKANSSSFYTTIFEDSRHSIWIGTERNGLIRITHKNEVSQFSTDNGLINDKIYLIWEDEEKNILACTSGGISKIYTSLKSNKVETYVPPLETWSSSIAIGKTDSQNILIIQDNNVYTLSMKDKIFSFVDHIEAPKNSINYITKKDKNNFWFGNANGIFLYRYSNNSIEMINHFFPNIQITSVLKDHEGNHWFTTYQNGVYFVPNIYAQSFNDEEGLIRMEITNISKAPNGTIWFGQDKGYYGFIKNGELQLRSIKDNFNSLRNRINNFYTGDPNYLWMCADLGLVRIRNSQDIKFYPYGSVRSFSQNSSLKNNYIGFTQHLVKIPSHLMKGIEYEALQPTSSELAYIYQTATTLFNKRPYALYNSWNDVLWIGTDKDLYQMKNGEIEKVPITEYGQPVRITDIVETKNHTLCIATHGQGIIFLKNDTVIGRLHEKDGIASNFCRRLFIDENDNLWVATINGLDKIKIESPQIYEIQHFNIYDGLLSNEVNDVTVKGDSIWAATSKGISLLNKKYTEFSITAPPVYITSITASDSNVFTGDHDTIFISYKHNNIKIQFTGLSYKNHNDILYRYKIKGTADTQWNYTNNRSIEFLSLAPGHYNFIVEACNKSSIWSKKPASACFVIMPPVWKKSWFIILVVIASLLTISTIFYLIVRGIQKRNRLQNKLRESEQKALRAQINPHLISNALNSIQKFFLTNDFEKASDYLSDFGILMRNALEISGKSYITLAEEISNIKLYLSLESMRLKDKFRYDIDIAPDINIYNTKIPSLIIQPFVENAIWHGIAPLTGDNGLIQLSFIRQNTGLLCTVEDNGVGFQSHTTKHKAREQTGIKISTERLELLNWKKKNKINIQIINKNMLDKNEQGTKVLLFIPF